MLGFLIVSEYDVTKTVSTFFARAIGFDTLTIHKSAIADYDPPVAMGSPANTFGNQPDCTTCSTVAVGRSASRAVVIGWG